MFARLLTTCTPPQTKHLQFQWLEVWLLELDPKQIKPSGGPHQPQKDTRNKHWMKCPKTR
jgi:hypothetical protein